MRARWSLYSAAVLLGVAAGGAPAAALTAGDVLDKMNADQWTGFNSGAVDMASHLFAVEGKFVKAKCALDWFFRTEGSVKEVHAFYEAHRDKDAVALLNVLINRKCGE